MPSRRQVLGSAALGAVAGAGCLGRLPGAGSDGPADTATEDRAGPPGDTSPRAQFQYDPNHTGVDGTEAPGRVEVRWRTRVSPIDGGLTAADGRVLVATGGSLVAMDADNGEEHWTVEVGHATGAPPALSRDTAYVTAWNGGESVPRGVTAVDLSDGSLRWRAITDVDVNSAPTLANGSVYVGGSLNSEEVVAVDAGDGSERWRFRVGQYASTPSVVAGTVYVGGGREAVAYALDAADGEVRWRAGVDGPVWGAPTVVEDTVYVGTRGGSVHALATEDGEERWRMGVGRDVRESLAATPDAIYAPDEGSIHALSPGGEKRWSVGASSYVHAPTVAGDALVITDRDEAVCLDAATGDERWRQAVRERVITDMVFVGIRTPLVVHDGVVYVASHGGDVYALQRPT